METETETEMGMRPHRTQAMHAQVGGSHYKDCALQPIEYIFANGIGFAEGNVIKYVSRWRAKNGVEDLRKARHYLDLLIEHEERADRGLTEAAA